MIGADYGGNARWGNRGGLGRRSYSLGVHLTPVDQGVQLRFLLDDVKRYRPSHESLNEFYEDKGNQQRGRCENFIIDAFLGVPSSRCAFQLNTFVLRGQPCSQHSSILGPRNGGDTYCSENGWLLVTLAPGPYS